MPIQPTNLSVTLKERLVEFSSQLDATIEHGRSFGSDGDMKKSKAGRDAAAAGVGAGAVAGGLYANGRRASGGNAKGMDAVRVGAHDVSNRVMAGAKKVGDAANDARFHGAYRAGAARDAVKGAVKKTGAKAGGLLSSAGKAVSKAAKRFDTLERMTNFSQELDSILNFETIDDATARKPVQKQKAPSKAALITVGAGTLTTGGIIGMHHKEISRAGKKAGAQIGKATSRGVTVAKSGYKTASKKIGAGLRPISSAIVSKFRKA